MATPPVTDESLLHAAANDQPEAFDQVVERLGPRLYRFLCARGLSPHDAEDLCQETFIRAWRARHRFEPQRSAIAWMLTIARNLAHNHHRDRRHVVCVDDSHLQHHSSITSEPSSTEPLSIGPLWEQARAILPNLWFEALWLRYGEDLNAQEIAAILGLTPGNTRVILHRARHQLQHHANPETQETQATAMPTHLRSPMVRALP